MIMPRRRVRVQGGDSALLQSSIDFGHNIILELDISSHRMKQAKKNLSDASAA